MVKMQIDENDLDFNSIVEPVGKYQGIKKFRFIRKFV